MIEQEEEVGYQHTLLQREYARQSVELNELREELAETRHLLEDQNSLLEQVFFLGVVNNMG